jgi:hypothetical protein
MPMKYFTLSAVCVLIYCLLLALSGIPGVYEEQTPVLEKFRMGNQESLSASAESVRVAAAASSSTEPAKGLSDWIGTGPQDGYGRGGDYGRQVRTIGLLFIVGWVFISFKLLTLE